MGSLSSRPDIPAPQPRIVYVPRPGPDLSPDPNPNTNAGTGTGQGADTPVSGDDAGVTGPDTDPDQTRIAGLMKRRRGRLGTIRTGFRGILSPSALRPQRKSLLGE